MQFLDTQSEITSKFSAIATHFPLFIANLTCPDVAQRFLDHLNQIVKIMEIKKIH
jgi:hypothetical protein